jgi:predicted RNA binding protein YcfA (HicA-like mRNA interferase family)
MSKAERILEKMRRNPRDWRIESLEVVARRFGIVVRRRGGSHVVFSHPGSRIVVTVPAHRPIKPVYVRQLIGLIDDIEK